VTTTWHADDDLLARYAAGDLDDARAYSLEAHLLGCEPCRLVLAPRGDRATLDRVWAEITETVDTPPAGVIERGLLRLGVREHIARLLAATPSLRLSWFAAEAVALGMAVISANAAHSGDREELAMLLFLVVAALLPVAGVAAAYGPGVDPAYDVGRASPMQSFRLLLIRAAAVLGSSMILAGIAALALPSTDWRAAAWLLPSLALTLASLALSTYLRPLRSAAIVTFSWVFVSAVATAPGPDRFVVFRGGGQIAFLVVIAVSAWVLAQRRWAFEQGAE
jgi:hypothetical protein